MANRADPRQSTYTCACCKRSFSSDESGLVSRLVNFQNREKFACALINPDSVAETLQQCSSSDAVICPVCLERMQEFLDRDVTEMTQLTVIRQNSSRPSSTSNQATNTEPDPRPKTSNSSGKSSNAKYLVAVPAAILGGAAAVAAAPVVVAGLGFGAGGIAAGSAAAGMMSWAWTTGIGVGVVSTLQSIGAVGLGAAGTALAATAGGAAGAGIGTAAAKLGDELSRKDDSSNNSQGARTTSSPRTSSRVQPEVVDIVLCSVRVENHTAFSLVEPREQQISGVLLFEPSRTIAFSQAGAMIVAEKSNRADGFRGTVSWLLPESSRRVVMAWSFPLRRRSHRRWLAVGLTEPGSTRHAAGDTWFTRMDHNVRLNDLKYTSQDFGSDTCCLLHRDGDFEVEGIMEFSSNRVAILVILRPARTEEVAKKLEKMTLTQVD